MGLFCKKKWKMGGVFGKKVENGFFVKNGPFLNAVVQYQYFLFYILLIWGGGAYAPNAPPCLRAWAPRAGNATHTVENRIGNVIAPKIITNNTLSLFLNCNRHFVNF